MRFVTANSIEQQDIQAAHRMRAILLRHRTALINQMRGLLGERGLTIARSPEAFKRAMAELIRTSADELTSFCQTLLAELLQHLKTIEDRIHLIEVSIQGVHEAFGAVQENRRGTWYRSDHGHRYRRLCW